MDQARDLTLSHKQKLVAKEVNSDWDNILWANILLLNLAQGLLLCTLWMIAVAANMDLVVIIVALTLYQLTRHLSNLICSLLNNQSQFAKIFLIVGCMCGVAGGVLMIISSMNYYANEDEKTDQRSEETPVKALQLSEKKVGLFNL